MFSAFQEWRQFEIHECLLLFSDLLTLGASCDALLGVAMDSEYSWGLGPPRSVRIPSPFPKTIQNICRNCAG